MIARGDPERRFALAAALLLPWAMLLLTDWTVTPVGMVDAWIYRALGRDLVHANASLSDYYYVARPFVLLPRFLLSRFLLEGVAHAAYGLICATVLLLAVLDLLTSVARPGSRLVGVLLFGTCMHLLRSLGWGYIDGSLITWFMLGLAGVARWYREGNSPTRLAGAFGAGGCFAAMLSTHPMTLPMLLTPLLLVAWLQRQTQRPRWWLLWLQMLWGGLGVIVLMGALCQALFGRFLFFMPIVDAAIGISAAAWKKPIDAWILNANWLVLIGFASFAAAVLLGAARVRRVQLTFFERFAWLNVVGLATLMLGLELFTPAYWLEYPWFASYFLPSALLALAAMLGERIEAGPSVFSRLGLTVAFVGGAALAFRFESPYFMPPFAARYFPFRAPVLWLESVPLITLQVAVALVALAALLAWRRAPSAPSMLVAALMGMVVAAPTNQVSPGDGVESEAAASVARAIVEIQDELQGRRPVYWYDTEHPLGRLFVTISSAHLAYYSHLREAYPRGAQAIRSTGHGSLGLFQTGDPVVIFDDTAARLPWAQQSFSELGITLRETRRVRMGAGGSAYWLIFGTLEPQTIVTLRPADLPTTLRASVVADGERVSEHEPGFLSFGPYVPLGAGAWRVTFHLRLLDTPTSGTLGMVDVGDFSGKAPVIFASAPLLASSTLESGELDSALEFTLKAGVTRAEFRVSTDGNSRLALRSIDLQRMDATLKLPWRALTTSLTDKSTELTTPGLAAGVDAGSVEDDAAFLTGLYRDLLGREPDPAGLAGNLKVLTRGLSREALRQGFLNSPEYRNHHQAARQVAPPGP